MERLTQYKCDFCKKIHTSEMDALKCEASCKAKIQSQQDEQHKIAVIRNKSMELDKLIQDFVKVYGYDPRTPDGIKKLEKTFDNIKVKTTNGAVNILDVIEEILDNITTQK
jgi:hypothetical protein